MQIGLKAGIVGLFLGMASMSSTAASLANQRFGDWGGECEGNVCYIQQVLSANKQPVMVTALGYGAGKPFPTLLIDFPRGAELGAGVQLKIDNHAPIKFKGSCARKQCRAGFGTDAAFLQVLRSGKKASVIFVPAPKQKPMALPLSLKGISKGLDALSPR